MPFNQPISEILQDRGCDWTPEPPAAEEQIAALCARLPFELPAEYVELLRYCNGGDGPLDAPPLWFCMSSIADSVEHNQMWHAQGEFLTFWFIGGNGGLETIGFDLRAGPPWPIIMMDCIAGEESAERIADDMASFILRIGRQPRDSGE